MRKLLKPVSCCLLALVFSLFFASFALAAEEAATGTAAAAAAASPDVTANAKAMVISVSIAAAAFVMALGTLGPGTGMGNACNGATNAVGRNPDAQGKILLTMLVGLAMIESIAIYALVIALAILYANPLLKYIVG